MTNLEDKSKEFAGALTDTVEASGLYSQLTDPKDAFMSGCYFGAVQGYKRGVNQALAEVTAWLPDIYNKIAESNFNMNINWVDEFRKLVLKEQYGIE